MADEFLTVKDTGHDELVRLMDRAGAAVPNVLGRALKEEGDLAFRETQEQVPFRHGGAKSSGRITGPVTSGPDVVVMISYGSTSVRYIRYLHEGARADGTYQIQNYRNGKKGQFVADPVKARVPTMGDSIAKRLEEMLGGS